VPVLEASDLALTLGGNRVLGGVGLSLEAGEVLAVVGPNGAGKSSLLRILAGEWTAEAGSVRIRGRALAQWGMKPLARLRAVLPQRSALTFAFRVREVVMMGRSPHLRGGETPRDWAIVDQALEEVDMADRARRAYTDLSGGEQQRVHLARVLAQVWPPEGPDPAQAPALLFLDEPTASLDLEHQHGVLRIARHRAREGLAVFCVLHDLNLALQYADRVLVLDRGASVALGPPAEVLTPERIRNVFKVAAERLTRPGGNPVLAFSTPASIPDLPDATPETKNP
jgi:iron complex transport system ATP-binding protein